VQRPSTNQPRWPGCTADHYGGDWHLLFRSRAALPKDLVRAADRCHALTLRASNGVVRLNSASLREAVGNSPSSSSGSGNHMRPARAGPGSPSKANVYGFNSVPYCNMAGMLLEEVMQTAFTVGLALVGGGSSGSGSDSSSGSSCGCKFTGVASSAEVLRFKEDVAWWLTNRPEVRWLSLFRYWPGLRVCCRGVFWFCVVVGAINDPRHPHHPHPLTPQVVVRFVKRSCDTLREYDMWGSGFTSWPDVPWRRSALQFILDLGLGPHTGVCMSVLERLQR